MTLEKSKTMFDDCAQEAAPTCIEDCTNQDFVTQQLWKWAHNVEIVGKILLALLIIACLLMSWSGAMVMNKSGVAEFSLTTFMVNLLYNSMFAVIEFVVYHVLAVVLAALARIVHSNRTMARLAELNAKQKHPETK